MQFRRCCPTSPRRVAHPTMPYAHTLLSRGSLQHLLPQRSSQQIIHRLRTKSRRNDIFIEYYSNFRPVTWTIIRFKVAPCLVCRSLPLQYRYHAKTSKSSRCKTPTQKPPLKIPNKQKQDVIVMYNQTRNDKHKRYSGPVKSNVERKTEEEKKKGLS